MHTKLEEIYSDMMTMLLLGLFCLFVSTFARNCSVLIPSNDISNTCDSKGDLCYAFVPGSNSSLNSAAQCALISLHLRNDDRYDERCEKCSSRNCMVLRNDSEPAGYHKFCNTTDYCNADTFILPREYMSAAAYNKKQFSWTLSFYLIGLFIISMFPLLYYIYSKREAKKCLLFDINPFITQETYMEDEAFWPEDMFRNDDTRSAPSVLTLAESRNIIAAIDRNVDTGPPEIQEGSPEPAFGDLITYHKEGTNMVMYNRLQATKYEQLLYQMIEHGPGHFSLKPLEISDILDQAFNIFSSEKSLLELPAPITVIGDIRGQYCDLFRWLKIVGFPPDTSVLFLGGFFEGEQVGSVETLTFIAALKVALPYNVFVIRGATEIAGVKLRRRYPRKVCNDLTSVAVRMFSQLPLAATINRKILCVHSGISNRVTSFNKLRDIRRPIPDVHCSKLVRDLIFNIPDINCETTAKIADGHGRFFGPDIVDNVLNNLDINFIIRARTPSPEGYFLFANRRVLTIWSATGRDTRIGAVVNINDSMHIDLRRIKTGEEITYGSTPLDPLPTETRTMKSEPLKP